MPKTTPKRTKSTDPVDVPADNPEGTMERFNEGLRRVLAAPKPRKPSVRPRRRKRRAQSTAV